MSEQILQYNESHKDIVNVFLKQVRKEDVIKTFHKNKFNLDTLDTQSSLWFALVDNTVASISYAQRSFVTNTLDSIRICRYHILKKYRHGRYGFKILEKQITWAKENNLPMHIFRLAGIYGPGRNALENVRRGTARRIVKSGHVFSRIHVDDIATVIEASINQPNPGAIYNVCDDEAAPPQDVVAFAAELLDVEPPQEIPIEQAEMSPMAASFYLDNKRVRNDRIKRELAVRLRYPDYRAGLRALLKG